ncbi:P-type conjugative transfer protein TrbL [Acidithiobacillus ferriphilus]|uniref:P-type conjugative transfer protein TrbL n=1 Tax=Acidithiobacillus ferriphilus TaxID=1689834 RepID=UPI001C0745D2|nr:P-type conjugative transfer protein TrbL [Acidithiobacillus ferriphilus]MBU2844946.1 P-type conjugative transfer protein TrbL [Acidithiobacillus ferriphilus]
MRRTDKLSLMLFAFLLAIPAFSSAASFGIFNTVTNQIQQQIMGSWFKPIQQHAIHLFGILAALEMTWMAATWLLSKKMLEDMFPSLIKKIITLSFFLAILLHANTWLSDIFDSFLQIGDQVSGVNITPSSIANESYTAFMTIMGLPFVSVTHNVGGAISSLWSGNISQFVSDVGASAKSAVIDANPFSQIAFFVLAFVVALSILYLAIEFMMVQIEAFVVIGAGVIILGLTGLRFTTKYASGYMDYSITLGVRMMIITLLAGFFQTYMLPDMQKALIDSGGAIQGPFIAMTIGLIIAAMVKKLPQIATSIMNGSSNMGSGDFTGPAKGAAITTAAVATGAVVGASVVGAAGMTASAGEMGASVGGANAVSGAGSMSGSGAAASGAPFDAAAGVPAPKYSPPPSDLGVPVPTTPMKVFPEFAQNTGSTTTRPAPASSGPVSGSDAAVNASSATSTGPGVSGGANTGSAAKPAPTAFQEGQDAFRSTQRSLNAIHDNIAHGPADTSVPASRGDLKHPED